MLDKNLSLYIHMPFCVRKCRYCDFYSIPYDKELADQYIRALTSELELIYNKNNLKNPLINTIFFGGGTPSLLSIDQWNRLCKSVKNVVTHSDKYEWTIECNPDSYSPEKGQAYFESGVTRLTFGVQSMNPKELSISGRIHSRERILEVLDDPFLHKFDTIGVDLIYGLPGQTINSLNYSLEILLNYKIVKHISIYELNINSNTPFGKHLKLLPFPDEDLLYDMAVMIFEKCKSAGFEQYEISNFAISGHRCKHNEAYWNHDPYIGLGCSAHSYIPPFRYANNNDIITYIKFLNEGKLPKRDSEKIDSEILAREMIFLGIRRSDGIDENDFEQNTGFNFQNYTENMKLTEMIDKGFLYRQEFRWKPTEKGILIADAIARDLIRYEKIG